MSWPNEVTGQQREVCCSRMIKQLTIFMYNTNSLGRGRHHVNAKLDMYPSVAHYVCRTWAQQEWVG